MGKRFIKEISDSELDMLYEKLKDNITAFDKGSICYEKCIDILSKEYITPIGKVIFGNNLYNTRYEYICAADKVLEDPAIIVKLQDNSILFVKIFDVSSDKDRWTVCISVNENNEVDRIYQDKINAILHKVSKNGILYIKGK
jgi:hypothetical protein